MATIRFSHLLLLGLLMGLAACEHDYSTPIPPGPPTYDVVTLAGSSPGRADGTGAAAQFSQPVAVAVDARGTLYVVDRYTHLIRVVSPAGVVSTLAGGGAGGLVSGSFADGTGVAARFNYPHGIAVDAQGTLYVGDFFNHRIRKITPAGVVSTFAGTGQAGAADGPGSTAQFYTPAGVALDTQGNVYVADYSNNLIRKITPSGVVSTLAGSGARGYADGPGSTAQFMLPQDVAVDAQGTVYVVELLGQRVRKITPAGVVSTLAGNGQYGYVNGVGQGAQFANPRGIDVDAQGNVYVADSDNQCIRQITPAGIVSTLAGGSSPRDAGTTDGIGSQARFNNPGGIAVDAAGKIYVTDSGTNRVRVITRR